jgi:Na+-transporting NADH:ubiquinone oxidoreductase subunit A
MSQVINIKRGLDIKIQGKAEKVLLRAPMAERYAVKPTDFVGVTPKLTAKVGDRVKAGTPLFFDKKNPDVIFTSPVSGEIESVVRGDRRKILEIVIKADDQVEYEEFGKVDPLGSDIELMKQHILKSGLWPSFIQRPYGIIANPADTPRDIYISGFDTAPLAPDLDFVIKDQGEMFAKGIDVIKAFTQGNVVIGVDATSALNSVYKNLKGVMINSFKGKHPAGNVGVQINKTNPINKGDVVWTINPQNVVMIGRLFTEGVYDASKIVALAGSEIKKTGYYKMIAGASVSSITKDNVNEGDIRYISGNVLTGTQVSKEGYLGYYDGLLSVIPEGNHSEFLGWAMPGLKKFSMSRTFFSWLTPNKEYNLDTNYNGGDRAFVMSGQYEKVMPMDIYPVFLLKAILAEDIDKMEQLGIYEVIEEDFALCDFVCTSKIETQKIVREGLELMIKELG